MWISDRHPNPPKPAAPPTDNGRRLATLARGNDAELRVTLSEFQDRPYCALRIWERGTDGHLWPARNKGLSVRISELADVIAALRNCEQLVDQAEQDRLESPRPATPRQDAHQRADGPATPPWQDDGGEPVYRERKRRPDSRTMTDRERGILAARPDEGEFDEFADRE
jgi:hypothetical protein